MVWVMLMTAWVVSLALVLWLERHAGDDPLGRLDPDAPPVPTLRLVPPPADASASHGGS